MCKTIQLTGISTYIINIIFYYKLWRRYADPMFDRSGTLDYNVDLECVAAVGWRTGRCMRPVNLRQTL
jgi:hypothetical protein